MRTGNIRTDRWALAPSGTDRQHLARTVAEYRAYVRALIGVVWAHWPTIHPAQSPCHAVERLVHATRANPEPRYRYFDRRFVKFPSYLRRAAIEAALGQVSSFETRYRRWQSGERRRRDANPPRLVADTRINPCLYRGQCIRFDDAYRTAEIKVFSGRDWVWIPVPIARVRHRHTLKHAEVKSPTLLFRRGEWVLSVPVRMSPERRAVGHTVCAIDLGMNTTAVASIITSDGQVLARKFFHDGAAIDRRDKLAGQIRRRARLTMGSGGRLSTGFCRGLYRRTRGLNENMAQHLSKEIVQWAEAQGVGTIVMENLKGFRPSAGRKRSLLKQRFHKWLHRRLHDLIRDKWWEKGGRTETVYPHGTSFFAYDGTGPVRRDKGNYALATFTTDKQYNADLSASYNIGARYWVKMQKGKLAEHGSDPVGRKGRELRTGRSPRRKPRTRVTLSTLWAQARVESEAPTAIA